VQQEDTWYLLQVNHTTFIHMSIELKWLTLTTWTTDEKVPRLPSKTARTNPLGPVFLVVGPCKTQLMDTTIIIDKNWPSCVRSSNLGSDKQAWWSIGSSIHHWGWVVSWDPSGYTIEHECRSNSLSIFFGDHVVNLGTSIETHHDTYKNSLCILIADATANQ